LPQQYIDIETSDGSMQTFVVRPDGQGPFPTVVMLHHIGGVSETMRAMARRVAAAGYACVVPALYYRLGSIVVDPLDLDERIAGIRAIARNSLTSHSVMFDLDSLLRRLDGEPVFKRGPKGLVAYGLSGGYSLLAAANFGDVFPAVAIVLGVNFVTDRKDSPHLSFDQLRSKVYCGYCRVDPVIPPAVPEKLKELFDQNSVDAEFVFHRNVVHGYPFPNRPVYHHETAEKEWASIFGLFDKHVHG
jgi:carboxymethylenebutenolidase